MHDDRRLVEERLQRVLQERILPAVHTVAVPLEVAAWRVPGEPVDVAQALAARYEPFAVGQPWGPPWSTVWLRLTGEVPREWAGRRVEAVIDLGFVGDWPGNQAEGLVFDLDGVPVKGINPLNRHVPVARPAVGGEPVALLVEAAANPDILAGGFRPTPLGDVRTAGTAPLYRLARADLAVLDEQVWHLGLDLQVLRELMLALPVDSGRRHDLLRALERALDAVDLDDVPGSAGAARDRLADVLSRPAHASAHRVSAVGHAHLDNVWLWPQRETVRKAGRTFANVLALARDYPELVFAGSQAQQYAYVKERYPQTWERVRAAVAAGTWAPVGGMWVEADGNLPGGEALARQLVHGKRFFLDEFGVEVHGVWLPDSFGYTAAYPQLARLAGMDWFLTQKISWNQTNRFPHHTFRWEGIDGTRVFTHFPPVDTYNSVLSGEELAHAERNFADKGGATRSLLPFGHGDGGGGPTREMLERARRLRDLEGSPRVVLESPDAFFAAAQEEYPDAPVWSGELYLELHRGTLTSQARIKAGNRRSEHLLREAELWAASAVVLAGARYPAAELDRIWKEVLTLQFHDLLPGTSIAWAHREAEAAHTRLHAELEELIAASLRALTGAGRPTAGTDGPAWVFNASPRPRLEPVIPADGAAPVLVRVPALGAAVVPSPDAGAPDAALPEGVPPVRVDARSLDNGLVRFELDDDGLLVCARDLVADRELLPAGARANLLQLHPDLPNQWDAWDLDAHYRRVHRDLTAVDAIEAVRSGPVRGAVRVTRSFGASRVVQTLSLSAGARHLQIDTELDWHEREKVLKLAFPLDLHADRSAAEIQFGHVWRPTHTNTSWDAARFEVCAHRWLHVGEAGYGATLANATTYGHDVTRTTRPDGGTTTTVRASLVRASRSPDPDADQGRHRFRHALHLGTGTADAVAAGYALNLPLRVVPAGPVPLPPPLVTVDGEAVTVEAVKLADDGSGDLVVRVYEALGGRARTRLRVAVPVLAAQASDLLERPLPDGPRPLPVEADGSVTLSLRAFEILTVRLRLRRRETVQPGREATP